MHLKFTNLKLTNLDTLKETLPTNLKLTNLDTLKETLPKLNQTLGT